MSKSGQVSKKLKEVKGPMDWKKANEAVKNMKFGNKKK